jgi:hypothetical protein
MNTANKTIILLPILIGLLFLTIACQNEVNINKSPILWLERASHDSGRAFDIDVRGRRLYISDGNKLVHFNIAEPKAPTNKNILDRPQGVIASYINDRYLLEVTGRGRVRISRYNEPSKVISFVNQFETNTKIDFFSNYAFIGSGKNIAVIELVEPINIFRYTSFLSNVKDIAISGAVLAVSLDDGSFKLYDLRDLTEPVLISGKLPEYGIKYSYTDASEENMFVVEEHEKNGQFYLVKQINPDNLNQWREVLKTYDPISKIYVKDGYLGVVREESFLDVYKVRENLELEQRLSIKGYSISDFDIYNDYVFISDFYDNAYLKMYKLD